MIFKTNEKYEQALLSTLVHIQTNLDDDLTLQTLANRAGFSPYHFHRVFREFIGEPVKEYVRRLRIEKSAYRLKISEETILKIALEAGFKTHESFTRAFERKFGVNPAGFRADFLRTSRERKQQIQPKYLTEYNQKNASGLLPNGSTAKQVRLEKTRPIIVAFVRHVGSYEKMLEKGSSLSSLWDELFQWGKANKLINADSLLIGVPQDDPTITPLEKQRFDVCVQIPEFRNPSGHIGCQTIPAGLFAVCRHYGPFDNLADTYAHIYNSMIMTGKYQMRGATPFEVYSFSHVKDDLRIHFTDIYLAVEPVKNGD